MAPAAEVAVNREARNRRVWTSRDALAAAVVAAAEVAVNREARSRVAWTSRDAHLRPPVLAPRAEVEAPP
ncbi:MAG: hypothetical protein MI919_15035 [Holophagales bacterium]|nr:hypothetical protein [Holophagales bacterium]